MSRRRLQISCAGHLSDRVQDLYTGEVVPEGIELHYLPLTPAEAFRRLLHGEFHAGEMSLSTYIVTVSRGQQDFVALPAFPSRTFRHGAIYVRAGGDVREPRELVGRRVGVPEYQMTAAVWVRGLLQHHYDVAPTDVEWVTGGLRDAGRAALVEVDVPGVTITREVERTLDELLVRGDIDAIVAPQAPPSFHNGDGAVVRLFADHASVELDYYRATGMFPIMHTVVLRRELYDEHPWVAASLFDAFDLAKQGAMARLHSREPLPVSLPWLQSEIDATHDLMGADFWPYGFAANEAVLQAACTYVDEQGLGERAVDPRELFAPNVLDRKGARAL